MNTIEGCAIPDDDPLFKHYHDKEWGVPVHCDRLIYEKVCLEGFQAGLSWQTILHRREHFRKAFSNFHADAIARFSEKDIERLLNDPGIIRNRRKILSVINNARCALEMKAKHGSLDQFFWQFKPSPRTRPERITREWLAKNPTSPESIELAKALKKLGWTFVGPTTMYALMQALGMVNDHVHGCPVRSKIEQLQSV